MVVHSYYDEDPRVRREAESLVASGIAVDVFALRRPTDPPMSTVAGISVHRLDVQRHQGAGLRTYAAEYASFLARATLALAAAHRRRHYSLVQVHTLPDLLVLAALPLRLTGVPVILDLHEAMPEFFRTRFPGASKPLVHRLLRLQERLAIGLATAAVTVNDAMRERLLGLGVSPDKVTVVANTPSLERFDAARYPRRSFAADGTVRLVYAGAVTPTYELDVVLAAVANIRESRPELDLRLDVYGRGDAAQDLEMLASHLGIGDRVAFHGRIPIEEVPAAIAVADIGLAPTRRDQFTDVSLSTKVFEYAAMAKPVVASALPLVVSTFPEGAIATYEPGDAGSLASAILTLIDDPAVRESAVARMTGIVAASAWEIEAARYLERVGLLTGARPAR